MDPATLAPVAIIQVIAVWLLQKLKVANWFPWLSENSATANRIVAYAIALISTAGLTWQWNAAQGQLVINGLVWMTIVQGLWTGAAGIVTNELTYLFLQIKQQTVSSGRVLGAPPVPEPPPVAMRDKPIPDPPVVQGIGQFKA
jgi:hypothetical protein